MLVRELMTHDVQTIHFSKKLIAVSEIMEWKTVRHVPVVDDEMGVVGIVSHRDLLRASISTAETRIADAESRQHLGCVKVKDVMTTDVDTIGPDDSVQEAARRMRLSRFGCLPVVHRDRMVGIVTEHDLLGIVEHLPGPVGEPVARD